MTRRPANSDPQLVRTLLGLHAVPSPRILDASYGHGRIWRGLPYRPARLDARPELEVDVVGDWCQLAALFPPASFDVVVWDPPHISDAGDGIVGAAQWADRYGTRTAGLNAPNVSHLFAPFLEAAKTVLEPDTGIVLAKIADQVHCGAQQWQFVDLVLAARAAGFTPCNYAVKPRSAFLEDPKWIRQYHLRSSTFWVVLRNGPSCIGPGVNRLHICEACGVPFKATRKDARTHNDTCRQRLRRARQARGRAA